MWPLAVTLGLSLASSWTLTHLALLLGQRFNILDLPDQDRKRHDRATPRTGGLAVCTTMVAGTAALAWYGAAGITSDSPSPFATLLGLSTALLCGLGLWDDKWGLGARTKLAWQVVAILPFVCWGRSTAAVNVFGWQLEGAVLTVPLILFWLVSCTNFVNLMDGLDGLATTVGLIIALAVAALADLENLHEITLLATLLAGALLGFLLHNWPPARIFLGDSGSLPLGFLVGALSLEASAKKAAGLTLAVPFVLLSIPMFDTSMAILRRKLNGKRIGQGDRAHIHHCLRDRGLSPTQTLLTIASLCAVTAFATILSTALDNGLIAVVSAAALLSLLVVGRVFGFNETVLLLRHVQAVGSCLRRLPRELRARFVIVRLETSVAAGQLDLWHKVVGRTRFLPGVEVQFVCEHLPTGQELVTLAWKSAPPADADGAQWRVSYAVPRGEGILARAEVRGMAPAGELLPYHELAEMLAILCRNWPISAVELAEPMAAAPIEPPAAKELRILNPDWDAAATREHDGEKRRPIGRDAA
jgi:UDP-GlcNAc:undecaprenyl-phosphate/decaprenyl-phosphate GlcNAc-1-phosphate transferase